MPASTVGSQQAGRRWRSPRLFAERVAKSPTLMQQAGIADRRPDFCHSLAYPSRVSSGLTGVRSVGENGISSAAAMMTPVQRAWHGTGGSPSSVESDHMPVAPSQQSPAHGAPRTGGSSSSAESDHMPVAHMSPRQPVPQPPGCAGTTEHSVGEGAHMLIPLLYATWQSPSSKQGISTAQLARHQASPNLVNRADVAVDEGASQAGAGWSATALAAEAEVCTCPLASRASQRMPSHANAATALASTRAPPSPSPPPSSPSQPAPSPSPATALAITAAAPLPSKSSPSSGAQGDSQRGRRS